MTYSSSLAMNRKAVYGRNQNATAFRDRSKSLGPISNTIILIVLALVLGLLYLAQVTKTNAYSYEIDSLQKEQTRLDAEHEELAVTSARLQSVERIQNSEVAQNMVSVAPSATVRP